MVLNQPVPPVALGVLARNGYARLTDLEDPVVQEILRTMEEFQVSFLGATRPLWGADFPIPGDALAHFSRQWEFPYAWANLCGPPGRALDAGSGITFFPFLLAGAGYDVECCDGDLDDLGLAERFAEAEARTGHRVRFETADLTGLPYPDASFDAVLSISVLEHTGSVKIGMVRELAVVLDALGGLFQPAYALDLTRPPTLLTSDAFLVSGRWRLPPPWRPPRGSSPRSPHAGAGSAAGDQFRSITVLGFTADRRSA